jgi:hypothetical protein
LFGRRTFLAICLFSVEEWGTRWRSGWGTALQTGWSRDRFPMVSLEFFIYNLLEPSGPLKACNGIALPLQWKNGRRIRPHCCFVCPHFNLWITALLCVPISTCESQRCGVSPFQPVNQVSFIKRYIR